MFKGDLEGDLEVDFEGRWRGTPKGTSEGTSNKISRGTCCQAKVWSGQGLVQVTAQI